MTIRTAPLSLTLLLLLAGLARAEGPAAFDHPGVHRGDAKAAFDALAAALERDPTDGQVPLLLGELRAAARLIPGGREQLAKRLEALANRTKHLLVDDLLATLADLRQAAGDVAGVRALQERRGFVRRFLVTGPFGVGPSASLHEAFEPELAAAEREVDPRGRYAALRGEVGWATYEVPAMRTTADPGASLPGRGGAYSYAMAHLEVAEATPAVLVYTGPSAKVWLNRQLATTIDRARERLDSELFIPVTLQKGWNRLLLKAGDGKGVRFTLRLVDREGGPIAIASQAEARPVELGQAGASPPGASPAVAQLQLEASKPDATPARKAVLAQLLLGSERGEEALGLLDAAAQALEREVWFHLVRGDALQQAEHLPEAARRDLARQAYARALQLDPKSVRARRRLADFEVQDDRVKEGILLLERALADWPDDVATRLRLAEVLLRKRWLLEAEKAVNAAGKAGELVPVLLTRASLLDARGQTRDAHSTREAAFKADRSLTFVLSARIDRRLAEGDAAGAAADLAELAALGTPEEDLIGQRLEVARALGDRAGELAARRRAIELRPADLDRRVALAQRLAIDAATDAAAKAEAIALLDGVLQREPERHSARRLLEGLRAADLREAEDRFWVEWEPDLKKLMAEAPPSSHWPRAQTVCLWDQTVTRIDRDGSTQDVVHQLWRILDENGKERYGQRQKSGELLTVRAILPSGEVLEPIQAAGGAFQMPGLAPGVVVEHAWRQESGAPGFQYRNGPFYFQDPDIDGGAASMEPFWFSRWVIWLHQDAPVRIVEKNLDRTGIKHEVIDRAPWKIHVFTAKDQPRFEVEPAAPDKDELLPWVKLIEVRGLEEFAAVYRESALSAATAVTPSISGRAAEVVAGTAGDAARAAKLFRFVQEHVTNEPDGAVETAAQILAARAGSKTTLFLALLEAAGVPARLGMAGPSPRNDATIDWSVPEPGQFGTPLVRLEPRDGPARWVFCEGHRLAPMERLPEELAGAPVYVCHQDGGVLDVLPDEGPVASAATSEMTVTLEAGGKARVEKRRALPAYGLFRIKEVFSSVSEVQLRGFFAQQANSLFPGASVLESEGLELDAVGAPFAFRFVAEVPQAVRARGDGSLSLPVGLEPSGLKEKLGAHRQRQFDLVVTEPTAVRDVVHIRLGPYSCPRLPSSVTLKGPLGQFSLLYSREPSGELRIERLLVLQAGRITPAAYPDFREWLGKVDEAERRAIPLEVR